MAQVEVITDARSSSGPPWCIADRLDGQNILITRLAHGIPVGGELGYVDGFTLTHAFRGRKPLSE